MKVRVRVGAADGGSEIISRTRQRVIKVGEAGASLCGSLIRAASLLLLGVAASLAAAAPMHAQAKNSCLDCHAKQTGEFHMDSEEFVASIHAQKGLTCVSCHGGDSSTDEMSRAMSPAAGFRGHIERKEIPALCAKCHSDAAYMRNYNPSLRTDQFSQYQTSVHGKLFGKGDTKTAVCVDCHGVHDIQPPEDQRSKVHPLNVAQTCGRCHGDAGYMKPYGINSDQPGDYSASVHHEALAVRGDLSAPTCSTCHGSHGAAPPGVESVARVCSTCHVFQAQLFDTGPHKEAFGSMGLPGCITCHSNHRIVHPTDAMIGTGQGAVCLNCHTEGDPGFVTAGALHDDLVQLDGAIARSDELLGRAERAGVEVGEAQLAQSEARNDLLKARVGIHAVRREAVQSDIDAGLKVSAAGLQAGRNAMGEVQYRRKGLLVSVVITIFVLIGLYLTIRKIESNGGR